MLHRSKEKTLLYTIAVFQVELEEQVRKKEPGFFIFIDVDNFKSYNDTYGHNNGDLCLKHFTKAMQECFPEGSILSRYGGDEFVVYLKDVTKESVYIYMEIPENDCRSDSCNR